MNKYIQLDKFNYKGHTIILRVDESITSHLKKELRYKINDGFRSIKNKDGMDHAARLDYDWLDPFVLVFGGKRGWAEACRTDLEWFVNDNYIEDNPLEYTLTIDSIEPATPLKGYKFATKKEVDR